VVTRSLSLGVPMRQDELSKDGGGGAGCEERICESCGRLPATEVLHRRRNRMAEIERRPVGPRALLCHQCWLDVLCGVRPMPPERNAVGGWGPNQDSRRPRGAPYRHLREAYAGVLDAHPGGRDYRNARAAFLRASRGLREHAAIIRKGARALRLQPPRAAPGAPLHSGAFLDLRAAGKVLQDARAQGSLARQEQADFREALAALLYQASDVCKRARQLTGSA
jgi:hypothetical protein